MANPTDPRDDDDDDDAETAMIAFASRTIDSIVNVFERTSQLLAAGVETRRYLIANDIQRQRRHDQHMDDIEAQRIASMGHQQGPDLTAATPTEPSLG